LAPSASFFLSLPGALPGPVDPKGRMTMPRKIAALLAVPLLGACVFRFGGSPSSLNYTVFSNEGKVFRVNNRTGEVWVHESNAWRSLGGAMHVEGGGVRVRIEDDGEGRGKRL